MAKPQRAKVTRRTSKNIISGDAVINSTFNNTHVTITDSQGNTISWSKKTVSRVINTHIIDRSIYDPRFGID